MTTYLDRILTSHRAAAATEHRPLDLLMEEAALLAPARGFASALRRTDGLAVIAEVKRRSPSRGDLLADLDPASLSSAYEAGGASCCSVLTDSEYFGGSPDDLRAVRDATTLPVLRKDFTVSAHDVVDARLIGADAVLLIVAALDDDQLADYHDLAVEIGLDALVEVHDEAEAERALAVGATLVGVNQRDLVTFDVDSARAGRVAGSLPETVIRVAESGIGGPADIAPLVSVGFDAVLVGESLVTSGDPEAAVRALRHAGRGEAAERCS